LPSLAVELDQGQGQHPLDCLLASRHRRRDEDEENLALALAHASTLDLMALGQSAVSSLASVHEARPLARAQGLAAFKVFLDSLSPSGPANATAACFQTDPWSQAAIVSLRGQSGLSLVAPV
jgi:hypothetical protein